MQTEDLLHQAIREARIGREGSARTKFLEVVRHDPENEIAWIWLSGLLENLEDQIIACERVLYINPENIKIESYLQELLSEQKSEDREKLTEIDAQVERIRSVYADGQREKALSLLLKILREENRHRGAWKLYAELSSNIGDKVRAYEAILEISPSDKSARENLQRFQYFQENPVELAAYYEESGEREKAIELYRELVSKEDDLSEFDRMYKNLLRLEDNENEKIQRVQPTLNILRLSIGIPILYIMEILIQAGLNPIKYPAPGLWLGIPVVALGSFFIAVAGVHTRHVIWEKFFGERGGWGSSAARATTSIAGWIMVTTPHLILLWDSYLRTQNFQVPILPGG